MPTSHDKMNPAKSRSRTPSRVEKRALDTYILAQSYPHRDPVHNTGQDTVNLPMTKAGTPVLHTQCLMYRKQRAESVTTFQAADIARKNLRRIIAKTQNSGDPIEYDTYYTKHMSTQHPYRGAQPRTMCTTTTYLTHETMQRTKSLPLSPGISVTGSNSDDKTVRMPLSRPGIMPRSPSNPAADVPNPAGVDKESLVAGKTE